jgi:hypothetical protein
MVSTKCSGEDALLGFVKQAIDLGASELEVEYEGGREHILAVRELTAVENGSLPSSGQLAKAFRETLCDIKRAAWIIFDCRPQI